MQQPISSNTLRYVRTSILLAALAVLLIHPVAHAQRGGGNRTPAAALVNGEPIPMSAYEERLRDQLALLRQNDPAAELDLGIADQILMQLIDEELLRQEAKRRGIAVTRQQAERSLLESPPDFIVENFTDENGEFQRQTFEQVVRHPEQIVRIAQGGGSEREVIARWKSDLDRVIEFVRQNEIRRRLGEAIVAKSPIGEKEIRARYMAEKTRIDGSFIRILHSTIPDSLVPVTEQELRAWYTSHKDDYRFPAQRMLGGLIFPITPTSEDSVARRERISLVRQAVTGAPLVSRANVVRRQLESLPPTRLAFGQPVSLLQMPTEARDALATASVGDLVGPYELKGESVLFYVEGRQKLRDTVVRARHLLVKVEGDDANADSVVRQFLEALGEKLTTESEFVEAATIYGQDGTKARGGDLGWFGRQQMTPDFEQQVFEAPEGSLVGPFRTPYGWHLAWVTGRSDTGLVLMELRFPIAVSDEARARVQSDAERWADALRRDLPGRDSLYRALRAAYPSAVADTSVLKRLDMYGDVLTTSTFAFTADTGDVMVAELPEQRLMVAELIFAWPSGVAPFEKIRSNFVAPHLRRERQLEMLKDRVADVMDTITAEMPLGIIRLRAPLAEAFMFQNESLTPPPDEDPTLLDSLVETTPDRGVSRPVRGRHGYYILRIVDRTEAPTAVDWRRDREAFIADYRQRYRTRLLEEAMTRVKEYAEVRDLRPGAPGARRAQGGE